MVANITLDQKFESSFIFLQEEVNNISKIFKSVAVLEDVLALPKPEEEASEDSKKQEEAIKKTIFDKIKAVWKKAQLLWQKIKIELIAKFEKIISTRVEKFAAKVLSDANAEKNSNRLRDTVDKLTKDNPNLLNHLTIKRISAESTKLGNEYIEYFDDCIDKLMNAYEANTVDGVKNTIEYVDREKKTVPEFKVVHLDVTNQRTVMDMVKYTIEEVTGSIDNIRHYIKEARSNIESYQGSLNIQLTKKDRSKQQLQCCLKAVDCFIKILKVFQTNITMEFKCIFFNENILRTLDKIVVGKENMPDSKYRYNTSIGPLDKKNVYQQYKTETEKNKESRTVDAE